MATTTATTDSTFMPDLWSEEIMTSYREQLVAGGLANMPKRSRGAQLLRDAALGYPEYPDPRAPPSTYNQMTATEARIQNEYAQQAAQAMAHSIDSSILDSFSYQTNAAPRSYNNHQ